MSSIEKVISNCPLCEERALHMIGEGDIQMMQCIACGYVSSPKFKGNEPEIYSSPLNIFSSISDIDIYL